MVQIELTEDELKFIESRRAKQKKKRVSRSNQLRKALADCLQWMEMRDSGDTIGMEAERQSTVIEARRVLALTTPKKRKKRTKTAPLAPTQEATNGTR